MLSFVQEIYGFTSNDDPKASYLAARASLVGKSARAAAIIALVEASPHVIEVVVGTSVGTESAFRGAMGVEPTSKLVWDPTVSFPILVDPKVESKTIKIGNAERTTTKTVAKLSPLPAELVLIHELGHAAQYLSEFPTYKTLFATGTEGIAAIEADNLNRNEGPICDDYNLRRRSNYLHYKGSNETSKWGIS
jgi:hypothetical protein